MRLSHKLLAGLCAAVLTFSFAGCGAAAPEASAEGSAKLVVGASPSPHAEILEAVRDQLAEQGIELEIEEFTDYVMPNKALANGDLDANFFQHKPYLDNFNAENGTKLTSAGAIHFEPLGVYAGTTSDLSQVPDGAKVAVPNDPTNEARALQLLQAQGLLTLKEGAGLNATVLDIVENPHNLEISELEAAQLPRVLPSLDFAVINGNYAVDAGITDKVIVSEDKESEAAQTYGNIIAVREGDESRPEIQALVKALQSEECRAFIEETYGTTVVPVF